MKKYNLAACGGTFDHFHKGHENFLYAACDASQKVIVGITSDLYISKNKANDTIEPFSLRYDSVLKFLRENKLEKKVMLVSIDTLFGPTIEKNHPIDVLFVTSQTKHGAEIINQKRVSRGLPPLAIRIVVQTKGSDRKIISATRVRSGEIARDGRRFFNPLWKKRNITLPESLRGTLQKPFGNVIKNFDVWVTQQTFDTHKIITVGDVVTKSFISNGIFPAVGIIDLSVERKRMYRSFHEHSFPNEYVRYVVKNPPGVLTARLFVYVARAIANSQGIIEVKGEEDLSVLPCIIFSPLGYKIYYGQPHVGVVEVEVTEETKLKAYNILSSFV